MLARLSFLLATVALALAAALSGAAAKAAAAVQVQDPERNATTPVASHIWVDRTKAQLDALAQEVGERVVDVQVTSTSPLKFTGITVKNTGPYARSGNWSYGTEADVTNTINAVKGRLIALDPYTVENQRRFAYVWVANSGEAAKSWHWNYDLTEAQVTNEINEFKIRLIDLDSYLVNGQRRYSYIGIANTGVDGKAWWWYPDVTPAFVQQQLNVNHARLIDVERPATGLMTVVMQRDDENAYSRYVYDYTLTDFLHFAASNGSRITDVEQYVKNGSVRYAASLIDNSAPENQRIRGIWRSSTMANAPSGNDAWFGVYSKEVSGPVDVGLAQSSTFNPLSVLKLIPHLYVMDLLDKDPTLSLLDKPNGISWTALAGMPDRIYCPLADGNVPTQVYSETLRKTLTRGLGESLNRAHEALLNKYGAATITTRAHQLGLADTNVYPGCKQPPGVNDWTSNTSTLADLGKLFENVDTKVYFPNHWAQVSSEFYGLMANWNLAGVKAVVADEAAKAGKSAIVNTFMSHVTLNGKGGGTILPQADGTFQGGRSFFGRLELPFVTGPNNAFAVKTFVGGYFVDNFKAPCNEDTAKTSSDPTCTSWKAKQDAAYALLMAEPYRLAIRKALVTWSA
jgi:Beta-lactamase enzyme family/Polyglycine hydrolase-like, structural repeat